MPQDCQTKVQCAACLKSFDRSEWTTNQWKNRSRHAAVCKACVAEGCTASNPQYYTCKKCGKKKGCKKFDIEQLKNHMHHERSKLDCLQCRQENADREKHCTPSLSKASGSVNAAIRFIARSARSQRCSTISDAGQVETVTSRLKTMYFYRT